MSDFAVACPACGSKEDARAKACAACGVDLIEAFERRAQAHARKPAAPAKRKARSVPPPWILAGALLCGVGAAMFARGLWILKGPGSGAELPDRFYADRRRRFAFSPPSGWQLEVIDEDAGPLRRAARLRRGTTTLEVCTGRPEMLDADDSALARLALNGMEPVVDVARDVELDGLSARRLELSAGRVFMAPAPGGRQASPNHPSVELAAVIVVGRDAGAAFMLKAYGEKGTLEADGADVERWLSSFRVLDRPWRP